MFISISRSLALVVALLAVSTAAVPVSNPEDKRACAGNFMRCAREAIERRACAGNFMRCAREPEPIPEPLPVAKALPEPQPVAEPVDKRACAGNFMRCAREPEASPEPVALAEPEPFAAPAERRGEALESEPVKRACAGNFMRCARAIVEYVQTLCSSVISQLSERDGFPLPKQRFSNGGTLFACVFGISGRLCID
ncbi:hypothetical protein BD410DRAFT_832252 [Rickenella mellea]|uniref:Uncharacterized protein n=1 Tax=Rickenella mellea TaxID=50990 RepID=A0A4Y7PMQ1_9AGAM|nr:hypothetical protein BD410DRAFT_832252 [Rickenella mellea]